MKDWNELTMKERAAFIKTGVANGLRSIDDIQKRYKEYAEGGDLNIESSVENVESKAKKFLSNFLKGRKIQYTNNLLDVNPPKIGEENQLFSAVNTSIDNDLYRMDTAQYSKNYSENGMPNSIFVKGEYNPDYRVVGYRGIPSEETAIHERAHAFDYNIPKQALAKRNMQGTTGYDEYLDDPDEIYSRRQQMIYNLNLDPSYRVTIDDINKWREDGILGSNSLDRYSNEDLLFLFNDIAANQPTINMANIAKKGGSQPKASPQLMQVDSEGNLIADIEPSVVVAEVPKQKVTPTYNYSIADAIAINNVLNQEANKRKETLKAKREAITVLRENSSKQFFNSFVEDLNRRENELLHPLNTEFVDIEELRDIKRQRDSYNLFSGNYSFAQGGPLANTLLKPFSYESVPEVRFATGGLLPIDEEVTKNNPSREQMIRLAWAAENPDNRGLNKDGTYSIYPDPSGKKDAKGNSLYDVGPGLLVGTSIPNKGFYTRQELDDNSYKFSQEALKQIEKSYNEFYGEGAFNKVDPSLKLIMLDTRYRTGKLPQSSFPNLYQAVHDSDTTRALRESRTTFIDKKGNKVPDNDRVRRLTEFLYPGLFNVTFDNKNVYVTRKSNNSKK